MGTLAERTSKTPLVSRREIQAFVDDVARRFRPLRVILFGSYAYGKPNADSDVDLLVVASHRGGHQYAIRVLLACPRRFSMDILVRSPAEIRRRLEMDDSFMREITSKGVVLYEADHAGMG
jgi:predicted nucleotidyltransferase